MVDITFSRRDLVRLSISALAMVSGAGAISTLGGCGGGGTDDTSTPSTREAAGQIQTAEIGGTGHRVISARATSPSGASASGAFTTTVAAENAQMLTVNDSGGTPRALALTLPGEPLSIGAASTALALAFMTPGIMASDLDLARDAVTRLRAQPGFAPLVAAVAARLPSSGLAGLKTPQIDALLASVIDGYLAADRGRGTTAVEPSILFKGQWGKPQSATSQGVDLVQEGFRYVRVDVQRLDSTGQRLTHEVARTVSQNLTAMEPAGLVSIGQLLVALRKGVKNSPSEKTAVVNLGTPAATGRLKFYVSGIGLGANKETPPFSLGKAEMRESYWKSVFFVLIMPFLDVYLGGLGAKGISSVNLDRLNNMYGALGTRLSIDGVYDAIQSADWGAVSAAMIDYLLAAFGFLGGIIEYYGITGLSAPVITAIVAAAGAGGLVISAANLGIIHLFLNRAPITQSIELQVSEAEVIVK